jgi:hypothetical protein
MDGAALMTTINPGPAILLLIEHAAKAVTAARTTNVPLEYISAAEDVVRHVVALRDLGLEPDDVVARIVDDARLNQTTLDEDGQPVFPERHVLEEFVRGILDSLIRP